MAGTRTTAKQNQIASVISMPVIMTPRTLPLTVDDAERAHGLNIYDEMYNNTYIWAATMYHRARCYEHGLLLSPGIDPPTLGTKPGDDSVKEFELSVEILAFVNYVLDQLEARHNSLLTTLRTMHTWMRYGSALAEWSASRVKDGEFAGKQAFDSIRAIPRRNYRIVHTPFGEVLGAMGIIPGSGNAALYEGLIADPKSHANFISADRLMRIVVNPKEDGIGGESMYRPAYRPWKAINMLEPAELKSLYNFAGVSLMLAGPEDGMQQRKFMMPDGAEVTTTVNDYLARVLRTFEPNSVNIMPHGTEAIDVPKGDSQAFAEFAGRKGQEMVMAILYSSRTLLESRRNSQADAGQAQDVADASVMAAQEVIAASVRGLIRQLVALNWGAEIAAKMTPKVSLRMSPAGDMPKLLQAVAQAVANGAITEPMLAAIWPRWFGFEYVQGASLKREDAGPRSVPQDEPDDDEQDPRSPGD